MLEWKETAYHQALSQIGLRHEESIVPPNATKLWARQAWKIKQIQHYEIAEPESFIRDVEAKAAGYEFLKQSLSEKILDRITSTLREAAKADSDFVLPGEERGRIHVEVVPHPEQPKETPPAFRERSNISKAFRNVLGLADKRIPLPPMKPQRRWRIVISILQPQPRRPQKRPTSGGPKDAA